MYSGLCSYPDLNKFSLKQAYEITGVIKYFPGGKYYTEYDPNVSRVYDMNDKIVWSLENPISPVVEPVSENEFSTEVQVGESFENDVHTISDGYVSRNGLFSVGVCRIYPWVIVSRDHFSYKINSGNRLPVYVGPRINNLNPQTNTLSFLNNNHLNIYDLDRKELRYVATIDPGFLSEQFEYYPESHAITLYGNHTYQIWDTRFTGAPVQNMSILAHTIITIGEVTYFVCNDHIQAVHYLYSTVEEKDSFGVIKYFPGGQYYIKHTEGNELYVYDMEDKVVWKGVTLYAEPVSEKQFIIEGDFGSELVTLEADTPIKKLGISGVCRIYNGVIVSYSITGNYRINSNDTIYNCMNSSNNVLAFFSDETLFVYDKELRYVAKIHKNFPIRQFEYYPEIYAITTYGDCTYQVWDTRFTATAVQSVKLSPGTPQTIDQVTYFIQHDHVQAMHYLYPNQYNERFEIKNVTDIFYSEHLHAIDYYKYHNLRYRIYL